MLKMDATLWSAPYLHTVRLCDTFHFNIQYIITSVNEIGSVFLNRIAEMVMNVFSWRFYQKWNLAHLRDPHLLRFPDISSLMFKTYT